MNNLDYFSIGLFSCISSAMFFYRLKLMLVEWKYKSKEQRIKEAKPVIVFGIALIMCFVLPQIKLFISNQ